MSLQPEQHSLACSAEATPQPSLSEHQDEDRRIILQINPKIGLIPSNIWHMVVYAQSPYRPIHNACIRLIGYIACIGKGEHFC